MANKKNKHQKKEEEEEPMVRAYTDFHFEEIDSEEDGLSQTGKDILVEETREKENQEGQKQKCSRWTSNKRKISPDKGDGFWEEEDMVEEMEESSGSCSLSNKKNNKHQSSYEKATKVIGVNGKRKVRNVRHDEQSDSDGEDSDSNSEEDENDDDERFAIPRCEIGMQMWHALKCEQSHS